MEKDINNPQVTQKDNQLFETLSLVFKDSRGMYLYKKSEKISKAFFLVTQHLEESQSIKVRLRDSALELLDKSQVFLSLSKLDEEATKEVVLNIMTLISLSDIGLGSKFISEANYQIITKQIQIFVGEVYEYINSSQRDTNLIPSSLFDITYTEQAPTTFAEHKNEIPKITLPKGHVNSRHNISANQIKKQPINSEGDKEKNQRQELIINTIRQKGELSIKDLTDVIKGCSEKTIQRELVSLVSSGVLLKTGERRWSRYSLSD